MFVYHYSHKSDVTLKKTNEMFDGIPSETFFEVAVAVQAHAWRLVIVVLMVLMHRTMCYLRRLCSLWFLAAVMADTAHPWCIGSIPGDTCCHTHGTVGVPENNYVGI